MRISKITIENFRSIKKAEINPSDFNVFVGQNNHGKTNFFEAMDWFFSGLRKGESMEKIRYGRTGTAEISVVVEFTGAQEGAEKMKNEANRTKILGLLEGHDSISVKRSSFDVKKRPVSVNGGEFENPRTGFDNALNDFLPCFEYVSTQINPLEVAKYGRNTPIANMLSGVLSAILEKDPEYAAFKDQFDRLFTVDGSQVRIELNNLSTQVKVYLEKQFPDCLSVVFEVAPPVFEDLLKNFETSIDDGVYTDASEKGDGMQRALMLAIIQAYADFRKANEESSKYFLFFIDEGELHLHPSAQRNLKKALLELAQGGDQIFINTHSSVLVSDEAVGQTIFKVEKILGETGILSISPEEKPQVVYELLGGSPADLLLPRNFIIVEGQSEEKFLEKIINRFYSKEFAGVRVIFARGDIEMAREIYHCISRAYLPLHTNGIYKDRIIIICDKPEDASKLELFKSAHPWLKEGDQLFVLPTSTLEEYYPDPYTKSASEARNMATKREKIVYAIDVGEKIGQIEFESKMNIFKTALDKCKEKAYS